MYRNDCIRLFGAVVTHHIETMDCAKVKGRANAAETWAKEYGHPEDELDHTELPDDIKEAAAHVSERRGVRDGGD